MDFLNLRANQNDVDVMNDSAEPRNYRLTDNPETADFKHEDWYVCEVPRKRMKQLMKRSDSEVWRNYVVWFVLLAGSGTLAFLSLGTWFAVPAFVIYGVLYGSCAESRFHECLHGTPFRSRSINEFFLAVLGFMSFKNPYLWRWSHARHHTDTIVVGRDPEIAYPRPPDVWGMVLNILHLRAGVNELGRTIQHCFKRLSDEERSYLPESEFPKVILHARIQIGVLIAVVLWSILAGSILPLLFIGLPTFYGSWLHSILSATQHAGLAEDIPDHRLNTRTVYLNPVLKFVYSNMNYHVEHHMFPMVPFYSLPALHEEIKHDCPPAYNSVLEAYREMIPALSRQIRDPRYFVRRELPADAGSPHPIAARLNQTIALA